MSKGPSWRLNFIDIDSSFSINTTASTILGYIVVRAPKGEIEPMFFPPANEAVIQQMIGYGTADWPDISEAVAFNREYGLYISAPPGSSVEYPSTYGAIALTKSGLRKLVDVTDKGGEDGLINAWQEHRIGVSGLGSDVTVTYDQSTNSIVIDKIPESFIRTGNRIAINYWGQDGAPAADKFRFVIDATNEVLTYSFVNEEMQNVDVEVGKIGPGTGGLKKVTLQRPTMDSENKEYDTSVVPEFTLNSPYIDTNGDGVATQEDVSEENANPFVSKSILLQEDIMDDVYLYIIQKSATEMTTKITISQVGYDKWSVDGTLHYKVVPAEMTIDKRTTGKPNETFLVKDDWDFEGEDALRNLILSPDFRGSYESETLFKDEDGEDLDPIIDKYYLDVSTTKVYTYNSTIYTEVTGGDLIVEGENDIYDEDESPISSITPPRTITPDTSQVLAVLYPASEKVNDTTALKNGNNYYLRLYTWDASKNKAKNVTSDYRTQSFRLTGEPENNDEESKKEFYVNFNNSGTSFGPTEAKELANDTIWIVDKSVGGSATGRIAKDIDKKSNIDYNSFTFSIIETDPLGKETSGGTFHGSLSETGVDSYGANIYFPNILPDDSLTFVEIKVKKTFDADINPNGFWDAKDGNRIITPQTYSLNGSRYVTSIVADNIKKGTVGGAWRNEFYDVINQGLIKAAETRFDEVYVIMEPTGQELFKASLASLRGIQKLTTIISPKIITKAEFDNPSSIVVAGRMTGTAQYVGEFLMLDPYTSKKYWCQPIGDVGLNLARIIDKKLGGWAPMWTNSTGGLGGQLSRAVLKAKWDFNDVATKIMDEKGINPIAYNSDDGLMILSQKTTQDPSNLTDWSYLGHTMSFDLCKREIRDNVMRPQIGKPNDTYYQEMRQQQTDAIIAKRITGSQPIWAAAKSDFSLNTDIVKAQRKFVIKVRVKVNIFSEGCDLIFENVAQTTNL
jgi:hypothetical protein